MPSPLFGRSGPARPCGGAGGCRRALSLSRRLPGIALPGQAPRPRTAPPDSTQTVIRFPLGHCRVFVILIVPNLGTLFKVFLSHIAKNVGFAFFVLFGFTSFYANSRSKWKKSPRNRFSTGQKNTRPPKKESGHLPGSLSYHINIDLLHRVHQRLLIGLIEEVHEGCAALQGAAGVGGDGVAVDQPAIR